MELFFCISLHGSLSCEGVIPWVSQYPCVHLHFCQCVIHLCAFPCLRVSAMVRVCDSMCIFMSLHVSVSLRAGRFCMHFCVHCRNMCMECTCYVASSDSPSLEETLQQEMLWIPASGWNFTQKNTPSWSSE